MPRGIPNRLMLQDDRTKTLPSGSLPAPADAVQLFQNAGGNLTSHSSFGEDPLLDDADKQDIRKTAFSEKYPSFEPIFCTLVNGNSLLFRDSLNFYIDITYRLSV